VKTIRYYVGGPDFHPVETQARAIARWLGDGYRHEIVEGLPAFERLDDVDLFVLMGLHWTGLGEAYRPMTDAHKAAFEAYVRSGRPMLAHHGAIASYDDWPRFGDLVGFAWIWGTTSHSPIQQHRVHVLRTGHPVVEGVEDFEVFDELYYKVKIADGLRPQMHAVAPWDNVGQPMVFTAEGGRVEGAGKVVYLANGHDMKAFEADALKRLWLNSVRWLLSE
jgi:type 1 glutamine amidotransferase